MKYTRFHRTFLQASALLAVCSLAACSATTDTSGNTTTAGSMAATVNGAAWSSAVVPLGITGGAKATRSSAGIVTVTGVKDDLTEITLILRSPVVGSDSLGLSADAQGEYSQGVPDTNSAWITIPTRTSPYSGAVTISQFDTTKRQISGTFHFTARKVHDLNDTVSVTNGSFLNVEWE